MDVLVYGATGMIGSRVTRELLDRGHTVTAALRTPARASELAPGTRTVVSDQDDLASVTAAAAGHDAVISATGPARDGSRPPGDFVHTTETFLAGLKRAGVVRVIAVGGAGSLEVAPGLALVDAPGFPEQYRAGALAAREALALFRAVEGLEWTYVSPAAEIAPGVRTGSYRVGADDLLVDASGHSTISAEDFAIALVDTLDNHDHVARRVTFAS